MTIKQDILSGLVGMIGLDRLLKAGSLTEKFFNHPGEDIGQDKVA